MSTSFTTKDVAVGRVISEDKDFILIEVMKNEAETFHLDSSVENNRFLTLLFVRMVNGKPEFRKPWA